MATSITGSTNSNRSIRNTIKEMIRSIESVMSNIHSVVGDIGELVKEIDVVADKLEHRSKQTRQVKKPEIVLDANRNQCEVMNKTNKGKSVKSESKASPHRDDIYLNMETDCEVCDENIHRFTYNEKYPLWMQYDTWHTGNTGTMSTMSEVSAGSDASAILENSRRRIPKNDVCIEDNFIENNPKSLTADHGDIGVGNCCAHNGETDDQYCGIYEDIMEEQLEGMYSAWPSNGTEDSFSDDGDGFSDTGEYFTDVEDSFSDDVSHAHSIRSLSLSDENVIHYGKMWTPYKELENIKKVDFNVSSFSTCLQLRLVEF